MNVFVLMLTLAILAHTKIHAANSVQNPVHHTFNTTILPPNAHQIGISGNYKYGWTQDFEIGTQALALNANAPNLYLKHRMFDFGKSQTTFAAHIFNINSSNEKGLGGYLSITSSYQASGQAIYSFGLMDLMYASTRGNILKDDISSTHIYIPTASIDLYLSSHWILNGAIAVPVYGNIEIKDDYAELEAQYFFLGAGDQFLSYMTATMTYSSSDSFNIEFGAFALAGGQVIASPYLNLFWRFRT